MLRLALTVAETGFHCTYGNISSTSDVLHKPRSRHWSPLRWFIMSALSSPFAIGANQVSGWSRRSLPARTKYKRSSGHSKQCHFPARKLISGGRQQFDLSEMQRGTYYSCSPTKERRAPPHIGPGPGHPASAATPPSRKTPPPLLRGAAASSWSPYARRSPSWTLRRSPTRSYRADVYTQFT